MDNKSTLSSVFNKKWCLVAAIAAFVAAAAGIVKSIIGMVNGGGLPFFGGLAIFSNILSIAFTSLIALIGVGLLLSYLAAHRQEIHTTGLSLIKVSVMIKGIVTAVIIILIEIFVLIATFAAFSADASVGLIFLLFDAIIIYLIVITFMYTLKVNKILGAVQGCADGKIYTCEKSVACTSIIFTVLSALGAIGVLVSLIFSSASAQLLSEIGSYVPGGMFDVNGMFASKIIVNILALVKSLGMVVLFIYSFTLNSSLRNIREAGQIIHTPPSVIGNDNESDKDDSDGATVLLNVDYEGKIVSLNGMDKGTPYPIKDGEEIIIGKDPQMANIVVDRKLQKISRKHCGIRYDAANNIYQVVDYSTNGTYINNVRHPAKGTYINVSKGSIINLAKEAVDYKLD